MGLLAESELDIEPPSHNLPAHLTSFVGRQAELAELRHLLLDPGCRLLTITGPGGMGKTRLALEAASLLVQDPQMPFADGIFLSLLAHLRDTTSVVSAVADSMGFRSYQVDSTPERQLGKFLRQKRVLLVLDNFEHLINEATLGSLTDLLAAAPGVSMLVTSRVRLNIHGEQVYPLLGLDLPEAITEGETEITESDSVKLFSEAARRADPTFVLNSTNLSPVVAICRLVDGMPLAIELAAAWTAVLEPAEILDEIHCGLDFLASDAANVPTRQRSLPVVLDASWQLLSEAERDGMRRLSVFRGGFTSNAARTIAVISPRTLLGLVGKGWLQRETEGRYRMHALLHQYAAEKLEEDGAHKNDVRTQHSLYYCQWLAELDQGLQRHKQQVSLNTIAVELENMRSACFWAAGQGLFAQLDGAINALGRYYQWQDRFLVGDPMFAQLAQKLAGVEDESGLHALAQILTWRCVFHAWTEDPKESERLAEAALNLISSPTLAQRDTRALQAHIARELGYNDFRTNPADAKQHFNHSYVLSKQIDDKIGMGYALVGLGRACRTLYRFEEAETLIRRGVRLHEGGGNQLGHCDALVALGSVVYRQQRFDEAERLFEQCLSVAYSSDQVTFDEGLFRLSLVYHESGRFGQAISLIDECQSLRRVRCGQELVALGDVYRGAMLRDIGEYEKGRKAGEEALALARSSEAEFIIGMALVLLGSIDLLEGDITRAYERLQEGVTRQLVPNVVRDDQSCQAWLGFAARAVKRQEEARRHLLAELNRALNSRRYLALLTSLAGLTLLLADDGEAEQAVELHALLLEHPYTANAHWFSEIITPIVAATAMALSERQRAEAEERGRASDLWEVAVQLVDQGLMIKDR